MVDYSLKRAGVYFETYDQSKYQVGTPVIGSAIITPTVKGKTLFPKAVYSMAEYANYFGTSFKSGSNYYEYQGSLLAQNYFSNGGDSLLVVPIRSGSYSPATSSVLNIITGSVFTLETLSDGAVLNNLAGEIANSSGSLLLGSADNIRWEISTVNVAKGTFNLIIRRGDDNVKNKIILETYNDLSLDPTNSNYILKAIGDYVYNYDATNAVLQKSGSYPNVSKYVRVSSTVNLPDYLDNSGVAKTAFTGSLPVISSGSFGGGSDGAILHPQLFFENISATNAQGYSSTTTAYDKAISLLSNKDDYQYNLLFLSGITANTHPLIVTSALAMVQDRGDAMVIIDPSEYGKQPSDVITIAGGFDSSYGAMYYPHVQLQSSSLNRNVWCPPSTVVAGVFAYSDRTTSPSFAPAGYDRASLNSVLDVQIKVGSLNKDALFTGNVNLISPFDRGFVILSQNTLQLKSTALDRINVQRMLIKVKTFALTEGKKILFEPNVNRTRILFINLLNNYLGKLIEKGEIFDGKAIVFDDNTSFDRSEFPVNLEIIPAKSIEKIIVKLFVNETGVSVL
jgi:hypothetical protein